MSRRAKRADEIPQKGNADEADSDNGKEEQGRGLAGANPHVLIPKVAKLTGLKPSQLHSWKASFQTTIGGDASEQRPFLWLAESVKPEFKLAISTQGGLDKVESATPLSVLQDAFWQV